jgi:hypothetical protein
MSIAPLLISALRNGAVVAVAVAIVAGGIGWAVGGVPGLLGGLLGAAVSAVFLGLTATSFLVAGRVTRGDATNPVFYGIVLGVWLLKLIVFVIVAIALRSFDGVDPVVFFWAVIAAVLGSLIGDIVALARTRVPYVSDVELPGDPPKASPGGKAASSPAGGPGKP